MRKLLAIVAMLPLVFVACGDDDDVATDASTTTETTESTTTTTTIAEPAEVDPTDPTSVITAYVTGELLRWPNDVVVEPGGEPDTFRVTEATLGLEALVVLNERNGEYEIEHLATTFGGEDVPASVSLGNGNDSVDVFWDRPPELEARLRITFGPDGAQTYEDNDRGQGASWTFDLGPEDTSIRFVEVTFTRVQDPDPDPVAREVWVTRIPAGPFAAG